MKAVVQLKYGGPEVLVIKEIKIPVPKKNEILVKVAASTVNRTDCARMRGKPMIMKLINGLTKPSNPIPGTDFAGVIEEIGSSVTEFKKGQRVFGFDDNGLSSHAEYLCINQKNAIGLIPEEFSFNEAVAGVEGFHYALNFVNKVTIKKGQNVLINGATGAIGSSLVQILKTHGLIITAVCRGQHFDLVKSLGANHLIDYEKSDFTKTDDQFDFVFDAVGKSSFSNCKSILKPNGVYISSELGPKNENPFLALISLFKKGKKVKFPFPLDRNKSVLQLSSFLQNKQFDAVIDRTHSLNEIQEAFSYVESGQKIGSVVIEFR